MGIYRVLLESSANKKLYFISDKDINGAILKPRVPKNFLTDNGYEDNETKRVCFAPSINQCLMAMSSNLKDKKFYVYVPDGDYEIYKPTVKEVPNVKITGEVWIKEPVRIKKIGRIRVNGDSGKKGHEYRYGDNKVAELYD